MKKGLIFVSLFLLLATAASAMTVTLGGPTGTQTSSTLNFGCTVTGTEEGLISLVLWHNISGDFQARVTNSSTVNEGSEYPFTVSSIQNGNYEWNCGANNENGTTFAASNNTFTVNVQNGAPVYTQIPDQTWAENAATTITLSSYFTDPDGDTLTYNSTTPTNIAVSISNGVATLTPQNWHGTATITFTADDGKGGTNSTTANLNVTDVNYPPYNKTEYMGNLTWDRNDKAKIKLDEYFGDNDGDTLTYSFRFSSGVTHYINITIDNSTSEVTLIPDSTWKGIDKIIFTAYDGQGGSLDSNEVTLNVKEGVKVNHPPTVGSRSPLINPILTVGDSQKFSVAPRDEDLDDLTIRWYIGSEEETESMNKENYTFLALSEGVYDLRVTVADSEFSDAENWTINVQPVGGRPAPPAPELPGNQTNPCGNGQVEAGETCSTCPKDVPCQPGYACQNGKCTKEVKKSNWKLLLIIGGGFIIFAVATLIVYRYYRKRTLFGGWEPKYTGNAQNTQAITKPKEEQPIIEKRERIPIIDRKKKTVNEVLLKHFIDTNLKKGEQIESIKEKLKKVGWTDEQIDEAYEATQLDNTFR